MNRVELKIMLDKLGILDSIYSLDGVRGLDKTILEYGYKWRIYGIDERGGEHEKAAFATESEACDYFYSMMVKFKRNMDEAEKNIYTEIPKIEKKIFIVSNTGEINTQKDDRNCNSSELELDNKSEK